MGVYVVPVSDTSIVGVAQSAVAHTWSRAPSIAKPTAQRNTGRRVVDVENDEGESRCGGGSATQTDVEPSGSA